MISGTDAMGPWVDTGRNVLSTVRPSTNAEVVHSAIEIDTGSKIAVTILHTVHVAQRPAGTPR